MHDMKSNARLNFVLETGGTYNPKTGKREAPTRQEKFVPCHLSTMGVERTKQLYGESSRVITIARLLRPYNTPYTSVEVNGEKYKVRRVSSYNKAVLFLERMADGKN
ncbi:hypothetical protein [Shouchella lonarensis]|uniref:Phage head-tail adapter protein n=1 Tax=Shouchella lonarensis TaxID=1464122 RepID=A0A1G6HQB7_9BACI|nr:hypothetical protein [Shouchella lonarensis]SDB96432.1 hypothetical protein SAMN05421737_104124 [Shouchella lonarensis]